MKAALGSKRKAPRTASSRKPRVAASYGEPFFKGVNMNGLLQNTQQTSVTNGLLMPKRCQNMLDRLWTLILIRAILVRLFAILTLHIWFKVMPFQDSSSNAFNWNIVFLLATTFLCYAIVVPYMPDFEGGGGGRGKRTLNAPRQLIQLIQCHRRLLNGIIRHQLFLQLFGHPPFMAYCQRALSAARVKGYRTEKCHCRPKRKKKQK